MKKLILIDGNALVHRAFHALPPLTSPKGVVTNAVFGFSSLLIKMMRELKPDYIAAAFDLAGPTFRHESFADYKIHRVKAPQELYSQIPLVKEVLAVFGIPVYEKKGYEADDLIGTLAIRAGKWKNLKTIIATGDLDTLQLVNDDKTVVFALRKGMTDTVIYNEKAVTERYGLKPSQLNDYKGLKGDPSDNIPGVPGIGDKTASELIKEFGSLEDLYKYLEKMPALETKEEKSKKSARGPASVVAEAGPRAHKISEKLAEKLLANKNKAFASRELATIVTDLDLDFSLELAGWRHNLDYAKIEANFKDLGFFSLVKRLAEIRVAPEGESASAQLQFSVNQTGAGQALSAAPVYDPDKSHIYLSENADLAVLAKLIKEPRSTLIGHGLKDFYKLAVRQGKHLTNPAFDTKIAYYLLNPDLKDYGLERIYYSEFKETIVDVATRRPAYLWKLKDRLWDQIKSADLIKVFEDIEMPLIPILAEMELNGIKIDLAAIGKLQTTGNKELNKLETKIYKLAGADFNINSPQQLGEVLFNKLKIIGKVRKTMGGALSTAAPELEKLRDGNPIIDLILQYRELQKLKTTYIEPFPQLVDAEDNRLHTTYNQTGAATGRLSSENPNLQNIPIKTKLGQEFRKAFIAENGYKLVSFDYSQIDLRVVAHIAKDKKMIEVFRSGEDIHTATASEIFEVPPTEVTKEMRRQAKALNFGIIYGMGPAGFARSAGVTTLRAREFITKYFADFAGVARYMEETKAQAHRDGYVETIFGRRRPLLDIYSTMPQIQAQSERAAINHPVQGTAADLIKLAMISCSRYLHDKFNHADTRLLLQVHDELVFEIKDDLVAKLVPELKRLMESAHKLDVPLVVDVKAGDNWQEMSDLNSKITNS